MSDFAGLWRLDGRPVDSVDLMRLGQGLEGRGIGAPRLWCSGPLGLVHRQHLFTPEDRGERMPLAGPSGAVLVADVRLSARQDLLDALEMPRQAAGMPDGALILGALERWGTEALPRLYGTFAFALWDLRAQRLTLGRDPAGFRSLFLHRGPRLVAFSTRLRALLAFPEIPLDLDDRAIADHLILNNHQSSRTLYRAIERVQMGHFAVVTADDTRVIPWWTEPRPGTLRHSSDAEVEEAAQEVLDRAVGDALRATGPISACLTGGLDSASLVLSAARQLAPVPLTAITRVPSGPTPSDEAGIYHDEALHAGALAALHPGSIDWHPIGNDSGDWGENDAQRWFLEGGLPTRAPLSVAWFFPLYRFVAERGGRVILGGELGNGFFSYDGQTLFPELFTQLRWGGLSKHLRAFAQREGIGLVSAFKKVVLKPFEPVAWRLRRLDRPAEPWGRFSPINPAFASELRLAETVDYDRYRLRTGGRHRSTMVLRECMLRDDVARDFWGVLRAMTGLDHRTPLADRRVIEFFGSLPLDQFLKDGVTRSLPRRLLAGRAPAKTVDGSGFGHQNGDWFALVSARRPAMLAQMERLRASPLARRMVDLDTLQSLLDHWPQDAEAAEPQRAAYLQMLTCGMEMGAFLAWREGGNG